MTAGVLTPIGIIGTVVVALIAGAATVFGPRFNDRAMAHQEVDLLKKLDPDQGPWPRFVDTGCGYAADGSVAAVVVS